MTRTKREINHVSDIGESQSYGVLRVAYREMLETRLIVISFSISIVLIVLFGVSAPRSTAATLSLLERIGYFALIVALCWPVCHALAAMVLYFVRLRPSVQIVPATVAAGLFAAANIATVAYALYLLFVPDYPGDLRWSVMYLLAAVVTVPYVALVYFLACQRARLRPAGDGAAVVDRPASAAGSSAPAATDTGAPAGPVASQEGRIPVDPVSGPAFPQQGADVPQSSPLPRQAAEPHARFLDRLPAELGRDIVYLKVRGHYVNVVTTTGSAVRLMRFADAVAELAHSGMQVHRSYWVAHHHVIGIERRNERTVLLLTGGGEVPISRTYLAAVRAAAARKRN